MFEDYNGKEINVDLMDSIIIDVLDEDGEELAEVWFKDFDVAESFANKILEYVKEGKARRDTTFKDLGGRTTRVFNKDNKVTITTNYGLGSIELNSDGVNELIRRLREQQKEIY